MKTTANKLMIVGRATMLAVGLAVTLALMLGIATAALAAVPGDPFKLGQVNLIDTITRLAGSTDNPMLRVNNASTGANATALDLQVAQGMPPMTVNSTTEVQGLNVDSLDGRNSSDFLGDEEKATDSNNLDGEDSTAFFSGKTYIVEDRRLGPGGGSVTGRSVICDPGDNALGGGGASSEDSDLLDSASILNSVTSTPSGWFANFRDEDFPSEIRAVVLCADFPPLR